MMEVMLQANRDAMSGMLRGKGDHTHEDKFDKLCNPSQFWGAETKHIEWMVKHLAHARSKPSGSDVWITWALESTEAFDVVLIVNACCDDM